MVLRALKSNGAFDFRAKIYIESTINDPGMPSTRDEVFEELFS